MSLELTSSDGKSVVFTAADVGECAALQRWGDAGESPGELTVPLTQSSLLTWKAGVSDEQLLHVDSAVQGLQV